MACKLKKNISLWYLRFSQRCCWGYKLPGRWHCCVEFVVPGISNDHFAFMFLDCLPWRWRCHGTTKHLKPLTHWHSITFQETVVWIFAAMKTWDLT